jgi:glycosyltransferase involved in cell wall biosynthesis
VIASFVCPSSDVPMGGVTALYEFANGLSRRGHEVHIWHRPFWDRKLERLDQLSWFSFDPAIRHHLGEPEVDPLPKADVIFGTGATREYGLPVLIIQGHGMFTEEMERETFRTPCLKVCVASWLIEAGMQYGAPREQFVHVAMGMDHDTYRVLTPIEDRPFQVGMLYNPHPCKGWKAGMSALTRAHERVPDFRAVVFGKGRPEEPLPDWITFIENPSPEVVVRDVYNQCRVFVQSSNNEGFGFTAVEAMACGAALVTTDCGGPDDYAFDGETALVASVGSFYALADAVERVLLDDELRIRLAHAGRDFVQRFDWDRAAENLEARLEEYLADPERYLAPPLEDRTAPVSS